MVICTSYEKVIAFWLRSQSKTKKNPKMPISLYFTSFAIQREGQRTSSSSLNHLLRTSDDSFSVPPSQPPSPLPFIVIPPFIIVPFLLGSIFFSFFFTRIFGSIFPHFITSSHLLTKICWLGFLFTLYLIWFDFFSKMMFVFLFISYSTMSMVIM